jgi:predicted NBD/HSP70 family sugar kinase
MPRRPSIPQVLDVVLTYGADKLDQAQVAALAGVAASTVSKVRSPFVEHGPLLLPTPVRFSAELGLVLAMSLGSESARAALVDANGDIHYEKSADPLRNQLECGPTELFGRVREQAILVLDEAFRIGEMVRNDGTLPILAAALAFPAPVDRLHRLIGSTLSHPEWGSRDPEKLRPNSMTLNDRLADVLGAPFTSETAHVMNDCNAAALAVAFERVRELEPRRQPGEDPIRERTTALVVRVSGGIGAGMIEIAGDEDPPIVSRFLKSRVMVGTNGLAGELGHLPISPDAVARLNTDQRRAPGLADMDYAVKCACGRPHHLQALAGWEAVAKRLDLDVNDTSRTMTEMLRRYLNPPRDEQDQRAQWALEDAGKLIGRALSGTVLTLDPHALTVLGALSVPALVEGLNVARKEWSQAFWTGRHVEFTKPLHGSIYTSLRGAGLAILRAQRHRKLRQIGAGDWTGLAPVLPYSTNHLSHLKARGLVELPKSNAVYAASARG